MKPAPADNNWVSHQTFCDQTEGLLAEFEDQIGAATDARLEGGLRACPFCHPKACRPN